MRPASSNCCQAFGTDDWLGMVTMRIHRPSTRNALTTLNDCEPPHTCMTASVRPWVGRTLPSDSGSQSIWFLNTADRVPWRSGLTHTWPSDHCDHARSRCTSGWSAPTLSRMGRSCAWNTRVSAPNCRSRRSASMASFRLKDCGRSEPYRMRMRGGCSEPAIASLSASGMSKASGASCGSNGTVMSAC